MGYLEVPQTGQEATSTQTLVTSKISGKHWNIVNKKNQLNIMVEMILTLK